MRTGFVELLSIELGRSIQLVVSDEVRSPKGISLPEAARLLTDRYSFAISPDLKDAQERGLRFKEGRLVSGNRMINIKELGVFNDGIIVDTYHTDDSDFIVNDVLSWAQTVLGLREPKSVIGRKYLSNIVADLDDRAVRGVAAFGRIAELSSAALKAAYQTDVPTALAGASWNSDVRPSPSTMLSADFSFYRRVNRPYVENRFFFVAPIPTDAHIQWIKSAEAAFIAS